MNEMLVLDASVVAKWYLNDEKLIEKAEEFLIRILAGQIEAHAPEILRYELGHLLTKAQRQPQRPIDPAQSEEVYREFCLLPITFHQLDDTERQEVLAFANTFRRGFYDSSYVWLAGHLGCRWLTSEQRYGGKLPLDYPTQRILTLESYKQSSRRT
ncbi:MAG: hypothetical protein A3G93_08425 [Nitrospinae bacterium RIFCSPLOWO2_12_FULL_45_22]|nr:MAG: hypothetical protein A3G93_08425 [Nitrospinae bacterium RIFCSPLOWO2_12_FULL_45_22]